MAFYYRITTTRTRETKGESKTTRTTEYREFLRKRDLGDHVAHLAMGNPRAIVVQPIKQATYIAKTRPKD